VLSSPDSKRLERRRIHRPRDAQVAVFLITGNSGLCLVAEGSIDVAVIVAKLRKLRLNRAHGCVGRGLTRIGISWLIIIAIWGVVIVAVGITRVVTRVIIGTVAVVIVRVTVVVGVVRIVIPWVKSPPEAVNKNKHLVVMKVGVMSVPIAMPVGVMPRKRAVSEK